MKKLGREWNPVCLLDALDDTVAMATSSSQELLYLWFFHFCLNVYTRWWSFCSQSISCIGHWLPVNVRFLENCLPSCSSLAWGYNPVPAEIRLTMKSSRTLYYNPKKQTKGEKAGRRVGDISWTDQAACRQLKAGTHGHGMSQRPDILVGFRKFTGAQ